VGYFRLRNITRGHRTYYDALDVGEHHNYYMGRTDADLTGWIEYFVATLASVFAVAKQEALRYAAAPLLTEPEELRQLDYRARTVLAHFSRQEQIASAEVATALGLSERMARLLLSTWFNKVGW